MLLLPAVLADPGTAKLPLAQWVELVDAADAADDRPAPPVPWLQVDRVLTGTFRRGVLEGTLVTRVRVPADAPDLRIPVLDAGASIASVELDGRTTSLSPEDGAYTVAVGSPGDHVVRVSFFVGREDDRFARRLQLALPPSGPTRVSLWVPETDIDADLAQGAIASLRAEAGGTRLDGQLDGRGALDLTWRGRTAAAAGPVRAEARAFGLFTLHEALVKGVLVLDTRLVEGETDRVALRLPPGVEVVDVRGDAVLQWRTEAGRLEVLLRYLVADEARVEVHFQLPVDLDQPVALVMPLPEAGVPYTGAIGVQGPAGLVAETTSATGATPLRDLPPELAALTPNPLLLGFELAGDPSVTLAVTRQAEVQLTTTAIDELEAATVLVEDGAEITKAQLHVRNQTRQYLAIRLPEGATLTFARIDGRPIRPATSPDGASLLLPLIQSETVAAGQAQTWTVRDGETLDAIADRFYGDPSRWREILDENQLGDPSDLAVGQVLRVTQRGAGAAPMSRFVVELGWTRTGDAMGLVGRRALALPEVDADVAEVTWHVYVPDALEPITFGGNLAPYSHIRYDHLRRVRQFLDLAFDVRDAWAGDGAYSSILTRRKSIYAQEAPRGGEAAEAVGAFPLVGELYRFRRLLPGREVPAVAVTWIARDLLPAV
ncbi:MAG: LysM peptidoglycan-binding domain-containing protein, partial [Myxococcota bacterium]